MDVRQQEDDQVGATPLSWNSQPAVEAALQEAKRSAYDMLQPWQQELRKLDQPRRTPGGFTFRGVTMRPEDEIQQAIVTPRKGAMFLGPGGFTKTELQAQKMVHNMNPKLLRAAQNDMRPGGVYTLDRDLAAEGQKGYTQFSKDSATGQQVGPIDVRLGPYPGVETGTHEFEHAFNFRRSGKGTTANTGGFDVLPPRVQKRYLDLAGGDKEHAAVYVRADKAAHKQGLSPTRYPSFN